MHLRKTEIAWWNYKCLCLWSLVLVIAICSKFFEHYWFCNVDVVNKSLFGITKESEDAQWSSINDTSGFHLQDPSWTFSNKHINAFVFMMLFPICRIEHWEPFSFLVKAHLYKISLFLSVIVSFKSLIPVRNQFYIKDRFASVQIFFQLFDRSFHLFRGCLLCFFLWHFCTLYLDFFCLFFLLGLNILCNLQALIIWALNITLDRLKIVSKAIFAADFFDVV